MEYTLLSKIYYSDNANYENVYNQRFNSSLSVKLPIEIKENQAFFVEDPKIYKAIINIQKLDKKVKILSEMLPGVALGQFAKRSLIDEIILTNKIEGVHSTRKEILETLEEMDKKKNKNRFYGLIKKYDMLSKDEVKLNQCEDIRVIYDELVLSEVMEDDEKNYPDGKIFRKQSVSVNNATQKEIHRGLYPENKIISAMKQALNILNDSEIEFLIRVSIFHYLFGYIHPFYEGNGRTSRFISSYLLSTEYEPIIGYRISYTIKENVNKYYDAFKICNDEKNRGDITPFILMFLEIIEISFSQLYSALEKRFEKYEFYYSVIQKLPYGKDTKMSSVYNYLIQAGLFSENGISTRNLLELLEISRTTLDKRLKMINENNLLKVEVHHSMNYYSLDIAKLDKLVSEISANN